MNSPAPLPSASRRPPRWLVTVLTIGVFLLLDRFHLDLFREVAGDWEGYRRLAALAVLGYGAQLLVPLGLGAVLLGPRCALASLGLDRSILSGLAVGLAGTSVLPVGYAAIAAFAPPDQALYVVMRGSVLPGIGEEVLYRAFLFGFLFRFAGWGFLPAALAGAAFFGAAHLYQGEGLADAAAIFAITALGAVWFAWLYAEWDFNIWVPAAFHVLMNMYWELFAISDTALGPLAANVLRFAAILLAVIITVLAVRRRSGRLVRGRVWLWGGPGDRSGAGVGTSPCERSAAFSPRW
ncbi:MAG: CPBP family intramembrane metalloprotease [Proteobacteria bacterium]|nr:CPBP family intramembrane metalloprotease [Pseudomonadota bacterium]